MRKKEREKLKEKGIERIRGKGTVRVRKKKQKKYGSSTAKIKHKKK